MKLNIRKTLPCCLGSRETGTHNDINPASQIPHCSKTVPNSRGWQMGAPSATDLFPPMQGCIFGMDRGDVSPPISSGHWIVPTNNFQLISIKVPPYVPTKAETKHTPLPQWCSFVPAVISSLFPLFVRFVITLAFTLPFLLAFPQH